MSTQDKEIPNPPAFPTIVINKDGTFSFSGMDLRDYFAAKAMNGFILNVTATMEEIEFKTVAEDSYRMADAMLKERSKH